MTDPAQLLEAHVAFEMARWTGDRLDESVAEHAGAVRRWLDGVTAAEVAPAEATAGTLGRVVAGLDLSDALLEAVADVVAAGHEVLTTFDAPVGEIVDGDDYDALVGLLADDRSVRDAVIAAVTASKGYRKLVSHVLYQGVKGYLLTENVVARKLPGASTLVKFGQKTMSAAAPNLEASVDRRITAFVEANLSETLRESRRYLEATLTPELLTEMADEVWTTLADRPVGEIVGVADPEGTREVVVALGPVVRRWRDEGVIAEVVESVAVEALKEHADRSVGELLEEWGVELETVVADAVELLRPSLEYAHASGFLEERIRAHLEPFYSSLPSILEAVPAAKPSRKRTTRRTKHES
ncbi:hypothetical protein GCM10022199_01040 [Marihabitans asiaticum]|uniref:Uncharacterized protein n=1 Tax=Marihabitans asiaticum TaxID=415218 RepID=A0A560WG14_9MICO|nr:hypothetical protein [Marihabitans asiaticum]TWD16617.1 hypothetical protein FB557_0145 [Marihabitans asiaticum]